MGGDTSCSGYDAIVVWCLACRTYFGRGGSGGCVGQVWSGPNLVESLDGKVGLSLE